MIDRARYLLIATVVAAAGCASTTESAQSPTTGASTRGSEPGGSIAVEVSHTLAREGALVIWLSRENERWARELGRIIPPGTRAFEVEISNRRHPWVLSAARATNPRRPVIQSRRFTIDQRAQRVFWDLNSNLVRVR